jgi:hypothetical protein
MRQALHLLGKQQPYRVPRQVRYHYAAGQDIVLNITMRPRRKYFHRVVLLLQEIIVLPIVYSVTTFNFPREIIFPEINLSLRSRFHV